MLTSYIMKWYIYIRKLIVKASRRRISLKDWVTLLTAIIQLLTAIKLYGGKKTNKKGTPRKRPRKRK